MFQEANLQSQTDSQVLTYDTKTLGSERTEIGTPQLKPSPKISYCQESENQITNNTGGSIPRNKERKVDQIEYFEHLVYESESGKEG